MPTLARPGHDQLLTQSITQQLYFLRFDPWVKVPTFLPSPSPLVSLSNGGCISYAHLPASPSSPLLNVHPPAHEQEGFHRTHTTPQTNANGASLRLRFRSGVKKLEKGTFENELKVVERGLATQDDEERGGAPTGSLVLEVFIETWAQVFRCQYGMIGAEAPAYLRSLTASPFRLLLSETLAITYRAGILGIQLCGNVILSILEGETGAESWEKEKEELYRFR